jgi:hypothetical protein
MKKILNMREKMIFFSWVPIVLYLDEMPKVLQTRSYTFWQAPKSKFFNWACPKDLDFLSTCPKTKVSACVKTTWH